MAFRAMVPNAVTALALCFGLTGVRFGDRASNWELALGCVVIAGVLDGMDGRIARLLRANSRFGAELDSPVRRHRVRRRAGADPVPVVAAPGAAVRLGRRAGAGGLLRAAAGAVQLADGCRRAAAQVGRLLTGVPAPAGAGLAFVPVYLWLVTGEEIFRAWYVVMPWVMFIALLMISSVADLQLVEPAHPPLVAAVRARRGRPARARRWSPRRG